ncbi:hypothetical protein CYLTODRAFT_489342 [Cylindrobasidium torrendii FP15055 ss-10]|uniref:F-box domain-containing protein n=1 Tax=Cylindrobasidium torrendii FP15055 ss-10 TaxID=1314674 RepID=A0A0D7BEF0_9AGAR|nr:hypothetical protein CYLTODRAFT_489342 [Cylindrobasidium torrendii FP15055 ss-10]
MTTEIEGIKHTSQISLPFDVLATIIETTALLYRQFAREELLMLSSSVHTIVERALYHTILLNTEDKIRRFVLAIETQAGTKLACRHVRVVIFQTVYPVPEENITTILSVCTNIVSMTYVPVHGAPHTPVTLLHDLQVPTLRRLYLKHSISDRPLFLPSSLTHLCVSVQSRSTANIEYWRQFARSAPNLTHIVCNILLHDDLSHFLEYTISSIPSIVHIFGKQLVRFAVPLTLVWLCHERQRLPAYVRPLRDMARGNIVPFILAENGLETDDLAEYLPVIDSVDTMAAVGWDMLLAEEPDIWEITEMVVASRELQSSRMGTGRFRAQVKAEP